MKTLTDEITVFNSGTHNEQNTDGIFCYRIPALLQTTTGPLIAGGDERRNQYADFGDIAMVIRRSLDNGKSWGEKITILDLRRNPHAEDPEVDGPFLIDMALVQHPNSGRIFALYDLFPEIKGLWGMTETYEPPFVETDGVMYQALYTDDRVDESAPYTIRDGGIVHDPTGSPTDYWIVTQPTKPNYSDYGSILRGNDVVGNIFFITNKTAPFRVAKTAHIHYSYSDDAGKTWSAPHNIAGQLTSSHMNFHGIGPGAGITLTHPPYTGRIVIPTYTTNWSSHLEGSQSSRVIYSDDHGHTWHCGQAVNDGRTLDNGERIHSATMAHQEAQNSEASVVETFHGDLLLFMRNLTGHVQMARSTDGGASWHNQPEDIISFEAVPDVYVQLSAIQTIYHEQEYILLANAQDSDRNNGYIHIAEVDASGNLHWLHHRQINTGKFAYNSLQELAPGTFGLLYETADDAHNDYQLKFQTFSLAELLQKH